MNANTLGGATMLTLNRPSVPALDVRQITLDQALAAPAASWGGQPVLTTRDRLHALRQFLPSFHREPFVLNGNRNPAFDVIVEDGTDYPVATVSRSYGLVQHAAVFDRALESLAALGFDPHGLDAELSLTAHGERIKVGFTIPGFDFDPGDGCPLVLKMNILNSVDKTTAVAIELEWLRLVCGNGMMYGIGSAGFRKAHFRGINEADIAEYLTASLRGVPKDRSLMQRWLQSTVSMDRLLPWVDQELCELWGEPTAARLWHILQHGQDAKSEIVRGNIDENAPPVPAHARPVTPLNDIPGAFAPVGNAYHVAQALAWVAKEQSNMGTRLKRIKEIPELMRPLAA